jgi:hypothetical protein
MHACVDDYEEDTTGVETLWWYNDVVYNVMMGYVLIGVFEILVYSIYSRRNAEISLTPFIWNEPNHVEYKL